MIEPEAQGRVFGVLERIHDVVGSPAAVAPDGSTWTDRLNVVADGDDDVVADPEPTGPGGG
jgi:hypothetical protein